MSLSNELLQDSNTILQNNKGDTQLSTLINELEKKYTVDFLLSDDEVKLLVADDATVVISKVFINYKAVQMIVVENEMPITTFINLHTGTIPRDFEEALTKTIQPSIPREFIESFIEGIRNGVRWGHIKNLRDLLNSSHNSCYYIKKSYSQNREVVVLLQLNEVVVSINAEIDIFGEVVRVEKGCILEDQHLQNSTDFIGYGEFTCKLYEYRRK